MTLIVAGLALLAATITWGLKRARHVYVQQSDRWTHECADYGCHSPDEVEPPEWVNRGIARGDGNFYAEFVEAVHIALWDQELEDTW